MASRRRIRRNACDSKIRFGSKTHAVAAAISYFKEHGRRMSAYKCKSCGGFHIGGIKARF